MTCDEQLQKWLAGESIHNKERDECCPDFSCCKPELLATLEERQLFTSRPDARDSMLMMFLGKAISSMPKKVNVHISGDCETKTC